jgi:uncharacterized coiled-coil protein SlyX
MKEQREMQTHIDELNAHIKAQSDEIDLLRKMLNRLTPSIVDDAKRYRWLNKYTAQLFMVTEKQMNEEVDRAMNGGGR